LQAVETVENLFVLLNKPYTWAGEHGWSPAVSWHAGFRKEHP